MSIINRNGYRQLERMPFRLAITSQTIYGITGPLCYIYCLFLYTACFHILPVFIYCLFFSWVALSTDDVFYSCLMTVEAQLCICWINFSNLIQSLPWRNYEVLCEGSKYMPINIRVGSIHSALQFITPE